MHRPNFVEYVMLRMTTLSVVIFLLFVTILGIFIENNHIFIFTVVLIAIAFGILIFILYQGAVSMQEQLRAINRYLRYIDDIDAINQHDASFLIREFEEINYSLVRLLKKSKKREDLKQKYNTKLKLKNRQRGDIISAIAHEFRNPIAAIIGYAQTLKEDPNISETLQIKFLDKIAKNGDKIEAILSRLVLWNKFESGETTLHKSRFKLKQLIEEVKFHLEEKYKHREILIEGGEYELYADRTLMEIVLKNLIENALKYSKESVIVHLTAHTISVEDKGIGIAKKEIDKVTKKFYRSDKHNWDNSMGLGLAIVKNILEMHNTELKIISTLHQGSIFSFSIFGMCREIQDKNNTQADKSSLIL